MKHTDYEKHRARENSDRAMENGIANGSPDGTVRPDKPILRTEATILSRRIGKLLKGVKE